MGWFGCTTMDHWMKFWLFKLRCRYKINPWLSYEIMAKIFVSGKIDGIVFGRSRSL